MGDLLRAQLVLTHRDGLPRDNVSMNYWFAVTDATEAIATTVAQRVRDLLKVAIAPRPNPLARFLGNAIGDVAHAVKVYEYDEATGERLTYADAPPLHTEPFVLTGITRYATDTMPSEVALCTTFKNLTGATFAGGNFNTPQAQRRGRTYFGPMQALQFTDEATTHINRPDATIVDYLGAAHFGLLGHNSDDAKWVIYSRPFAGRAAISAEARHAAGGPNRPLPALPARPGTAYLVEQISVDNSWDTQRRRGERATTRTIF